MNTTANTVTLLGQAYPFRFGIKFQRIFMQHYKLKKLDAFQAKMQTLNDGTMNGLEVLGAVVLCAVIAGSKKPVKLDPDDILDELMTKGLDAIQPMMDALKKAQPEPDETPAVVGKSSK